eukprot:3768087-Rhodomonas_salina.2
MFGRELVCSHPTQFVKRSLIEICSGPIRVRNPTLQNPPAGLTRLLDVWNADGVDPEQDSTHLCYHCQVVPCFIVSTTSGRGVRPHWDHQSVLTRDGVVRLDRAGSPEEFRTAGKRPCGSRGRLNDDGRGLSTQDRSVQSWLSQLDSWLGCCYSRLSGSTYLVCHRVSMCVREAVFQHSQHRVVLVTRK